MMKCKKLLFLFVAILSPMLVSCKAEGVKQQESSINLAEIPEYTGDAYIVINDNIPDFSDADMVSDSFELYSDLDYLGRCGAAYANIGTDIMPTEERGGI